MFRLLTVGIVLVSSLNVFADPASCRSVAREAIKQINSSARDFNIVSNNLQTIANRVDSWNYVVPNGARLDTSNQVQQLRNYSNEMQSLGSTYSENAETLLDQLENCK